jgi:hypothetical protein
MSLLRLRVRLLWYAVLPTRWWGDGPCSAAWSKGYEQALALAGLTPDDVESRVIGIDEDGVGIVEPRLKRRPLSAARREEQR